MTMTAEEHDTAHEIVRLRRALREIRRALTCTDSQPWQGCTVHHKAEHLQAHAREAVALIDRVLSKPERTGATQTHSTSRLQVGEIPHPATDE